MSDLRYLTVDILIEELQKLQSCGKGHYGVFPMVFNDDVGHYSGDDESWINDVDDEDECVTIGGE